MSTRCNVIVRGKGKTYTLYRHLDGYPEGTGEHLKEELTRWWDDDSARFANHLIQLGNPHHRYELTNEIHSDCEFLYVVRLVSRRVDCYKVPFQQVWNMTPEQAAEFLTEEKLATRQYRQFRFQAPPAQNPFTARQ